MTGEKPVAWIRVEASDEARCDSLTRLNAIDPDWKQAKKAWNDAEEALLEGQGAARERFPIEAYDTETSHSLNALIAAFEDCQAKYQRIDSRRRSLQDENRKLTEQTLRLLSEAREPGIFDGGDKLGPHGWKMVKVRDLVGGPDMSKEIDNQVWPAMTLETHGYHTVGEYLQGRDRLIPALIDDAEIGAPLIEAVDTAVYRFLEKREILDRWPKGVSPPSGEQMLLLQGQIGTATDDMLEAAAPEPGKPSKSRKGKKAAETAEKAPEADQAADNWEEHKADRAPPLLGSDLYDIATKGKSGTLFSKAKNAAGKRVAAMMEPWAKIVAAHIGDDETPPDQHALARFTEVFGGSPAAALQRIWYAIHAGQPIPQSPISEGSTELLVQCMLAESDEQIRVAVKDGWLPDTEQCSEVLGAFVRKVASIEDDRYERGMKELDLFDPGLSGVVAVYGTAIRKAVLDRQRPGPKPKPAKPDGEKLTSPKPEKPTRPAKKGKATKKAGGKKKAAKK